MAYPLVGESTGTSIIFTVSGFTAQVTNIRFSNLARRAIETTHLRTPPGSPSNPGSQTFRPAKLTNPGQMELDLFFRPDVFPPIEEDAELILLNFPRVEEESFIRTWAFDGFVTDFGNTILLEQAMQGTLQVKLASGITQMTLQVQDLANGVGFTDPGTVYPLKVLSTGQAVNYSNPGDVEPLRTLSGNAVRWMTPGELFVDSSGQPFYFETPAYVA